MTLSVDLFFSFRSPYSYLALPKVLKLVADYDVTVNLRPVYPLAVRVPGFFKRTDPQFLSYVALDSRRVAEHASIPFRHHRVAGGGRPPPAPQNVACGFPAPRSSAVGSQLSLLFQVSFPWSADLLFE
jgi:hypothetical protein